MDGPNALIANVPPADMAVPLAVNAVIASPSGSAAVTVNVIKLPAGPDAVNGAVTVGARWQPLQTEMSVDALPDSAPSLAVKVTVYDPACVNVGVQLNVPDVFPAFVVNVLPVVGGLLAAVNETIASPSGSAADTVNVSREFSLVALVAGAVTTGARGQSQMLTVV